MMATDQIRARKSNKLVSNKKKDGKTIQCKKSVSGCLKILKNSQIFGNGTEKTGNFLFIRVPYEHQEKLAKGVD